MECGRNFKNGGLLSKAASSLTLLPEVIATRNKVFQERSLRSHVDEGSNGCCVRHLKTNGRSHGYALLYIPRRNLLVVGCEKSENESIFEWYADIAARYTLREERERPESLRCMRKSRARGSPA